MSDSESVPAPPLLPAVEAAAAAGDGAAAWVGPAVAEDLRHACCDAFNAFNAFNVSRGGGGAPPRAPSDERPCLWIHNVLSPAECAAVCAASLQYHQQSPPGSPDEYTQPGIRSQFTSEDPGMSELLWGRIQDLLPRELDGGVAIGLKTKIAHARYLEGQVGFPHMDFRHGHTGPHYGLRGAAGAAGGGGAEKGEGGPEEVHIASRISFTVYLNDDYEGGQLSFLGKLNMDGSYEGEHSRCDGRLGSAVLFYQGVPEFAHMPHRITRGCKSIMRADVLYKFSSKAAADVGCASLTYE